MVTTYSAIFHGSKCTHWCDQCDEWSLTTEHSFTAVNAFMDVTGVTSVSSVLALALSILPYPAYLSTCLPLLCFFASSLLSICLSAVPCLLAFCAVPLPLLCSLCYGCHVQQCSHRGHGLQAQARRGAGRA